MKIDAHQHFWQYHPSEHAWIEESMSMLRRNFLPQDLKPELEAAGFDGCVAVQASQSEAETEFLLQLAREHAFIKGVVGWVDLRSGNLEERLQYYAQQPLLKGFRHVVQDEPDDLFLIRANFLRGIGLLSQYNFSYDILIYPKQLPAANKLAQLFPHQTFVLDHLAKPLIKEQQMNPWKAGIQALANHSNVYCKLSGMVTEAAWNGWKAADFRPYLDVVWQAFGPDRLLIGSDWPVCLLSATYAEVMGIVTDYLNPFPEDVRAKVLGGNAVKAYQLSQ